jgi:hypothetical protein
MNDDPDMDDPKFAIERYADYAASESLLDYAASQPVFLHVGSGCDWNPVARFSDVCRVFVFCVGTEYKPKLPPFALADCPRSLRSQFGEESGGTLIQEVIRDTGRISSFRQGYWSRVERRIDIMGRNATRLYKRERSLFLAFVQADPVELFQRLFVDRRIAPKFVYLHPTEAEHRFRAAMRDAGPALPKYHVGKWPLACPPWTLLWQKYRSWGDRAVFCQRTAEPHQMLDPIHHERLVWVDLPLSPTNIGEAQAVHLTLPEYLAHRWPDEIRHIFIDTSRGRLPAELTAIDPRLSPLPLSGLPMSKAFPKLADVCDEENVRAIHTGRFGFEDETEALRAVWSMRCRFSLTIHCETQGDMASLQGYTCGDLPL